MADIGTWIYKNASNPTVRRAGRLIPDVILELKNAYPFHKTLPTLVSSMGYRYTSYECEESDGTKYINDGTELHLLRYVYSHPDLAHLRNNPRAVLDAIEEFSQTKSWLMNIGSKKGPLIVDMIEKRRPSVMIEMGGYVGYSAVLFGDAVRRTGVSGARYWSLEFDPAFAAIAASIVDLAGLSDVVKVVVGPAGDSLRRLQGEGLLKNIEMAFIDHVSDLYVPDLQVCEELKLLKKNALIVADNIISPGAPQYLAYVMNHQNYDSREIKSVIPGGTMDGTIYPDREVRPFSSRPDRPFSYCSLTVSCTGLHSSFAGQV